jgi:hypothetical protein
VAKGRRTFRSPEMILPSKCQWRCNSFVHILNWQWYSNLSQIFNRSNSMKWKSFESNWSNSSRTIDRIWMNSVRQFTVSQKHCNRKSTIAAIRDINGCKNAMIMEIKNLIGKENHSKLSFFRWLFCFQCRMDRLKELLGVMNSLMKKNSGFWWFSFPFPRFFPITGENNNHCPWHRHGWV